MRLIFTIVAAAALAGCETMSTAQMGASAESEGFTRISTRDQMTPILDRRLEFSPGFIVIHSDGTLSGQFPDGSVAGTWMMQDGFWCRTLIQGSGTPTDCQLLVLNDGEVSFTRNRGTGSGGSMQIGAPV